MQQAAGGRRWGVHQSPVSEGFTLIECLVSLVIGLLLLGAIYGFVGSFYRKGSVSPDFATREQVNRLIIHSIRMANFAGCRRPSGWMRSFSNPDNDHVLSIWRASAQSAFVMETQRDASFLITDRGVNFESDDAVLVTDCLQVATGRVREVIKCRGGVQKLMLERPLTRHFSQGASVFHYGEEKYFVKRNVQSGNQVLYFMNRRRETVPLLKGVREWQIHYQREGGNVRAVSLQLAPRWFVEAAIRNP